MPGCENMLAITCEYNHEQHARVKLNKRLLNWFRQTLILACTLVFESI